MNAESKSKITCYSAGEGEFMRRSQEWRGSLLRPLLAGMVRLRLTANHLTFLSLAAGLAFCPVFIWGSKLAALGLLLAHVCLDGLDGPLARFSGRASSQGSFTDTATDQLVITFSTITMMHCGFVGLWSGALYLFFYSTVVIFAMVRSALAVPYSWLFRPRFIVYAWFPIEVYWWRGSLDVLLWLASGLLAAKMLTGFVQIRRKM